MADTDLESSSALIGRPPDLDLIQAQEESLRSATCRRRLRSCRICVAASTAVQVTLLAALWLAQRREGAKSQDLDMAAVSAVYEGGLGEISVQGSGIALGSLNESARQEAALQHKWKAIAKNAAGELSHDMRGQFDQVAHKVTREEEEKLHKDWSGALDKQSHSWSDIIQQQFHEDLDSARGWAQRAEAGWDQNLDNASTWTRGLDSWWSNVERSAHFQEALKRERSWQQHLKEGFDHRLGDFSNQTRQINQEMLKKQMQHAMQSSVATVGNLSTEADHWRHDIKDLMSTREFLNGTTESKCLDLDGLYMEKVVHSNLGGHGPDKGEASLILVGSHKEGGVTVKKLAFKVTATSSYAPGWNQMNGLSHGLVGKYGQVTLKPGTNVSLRIRTFDLQSGELIHMPTAVFTFFDLDEDTGHEASEFINVRGFGSSEVSKHTEVQRVDNSDGSVTFQASTPGTFEDNPVDPLLLTEQQKNRAVTVRFAEVDEVTIVLGATAAPSDPGTWRCFTFVAHPVMKCAKTLGQKTKTGPSEVALLMAGLVCLLVAACIGFLCCCPW